LSSPFFIYNILSKVYGTKNSFGSIESLSKLSKNYIESANSRPQTEADDESEQSTDERLANNSELDNIDNRYRRLKTHIHAQYRDISSDLPNGVNSNIVGVKHIYREIGFVLDTIANLETADSNQPFNPSSFKHNNQPFTNDEVQIINNQLDELQSKLIETINNSQLPLEATMPHIESVKSEINDLKTEVTNPNLGRKDWKNHLINTMISLTFTLSFSQEARNTIFIYFQNLFIYLQQNIFLLKS